MEKEFTIPFFGSSFTGMHIMDAVENVAKKEGLHVHEKPFHSSSSSGYLDAKTTNWMGWIGLFYLARIETEPVVSGQSYDSLKLRLTTCGLGTNRAEQRVETIKNLLMTQLEIKDEFVE
jgi:hypothetical protein